MKKLARSPFRFLLTGFCLWSVLANNVGAALYYWDNNGASAPTSGTWDTTTAQWATSSTLTASPVVWNTANAAVFPAGASAISTLTITVNTPIAFAGIFNGLTTTIGVTNLIFSGSGSLSLNSGIQGFWTGTNTLNTIIRVPVTGSGTVQHQGSASAGSLYLSGNNTHSGGFSFGASSGVNIANGNVFGTGPVTNAVSSTILAIVATDSSGATFATAPMTITNAWQAYGASGTEILVGLVAAPVTFTGPWSLPGAAGTTTTLDTRNTTWTILGPISGAANLSKKNTSLLVLGTTNTYSGSTVIQNGSVSVSSLNKVTGGTASSSLGHPTTVANGTIGLGTTTTAGTLIYTGVGETTDRAIDMAGTTGGANIENDGAGALIFTGVNTASGVGAKTLTLQGANGGANTISGALVDSSSGATALAKSQGGKWILSGANTYSGNTTVNAGTLAQGAANVIPSGTGKGTIAVSGGATFDLGGFDCSVNGFGSSAGFIDNTGAGAVTLTIGTANGAGTHSGVIKNTGGTLSVTKTGTGAIVLSGSSTYSGKTIVNGGTLTINNAETALGTPPASPVADQLTLNNGTTFALGTAASFSLNVNRGILLSGSVTISMSSKNLTVPGVVSGTGSLTKSGSTDLILSGANTYSGGTTVTGGGLTLNNNLAIGTGSLTITPAGICTITGKSGTTVLTNNITVNVGGGQVIDFFATSGNALTLNGQISGSAAIFRGNGGGAGNLTLNGDNSTYSGTLTLQQGPLVLGNKNALGTSGLVVTPGSVAISLSANTALTGANAVGNAVTLNGTLPVNGSSDLELSGVISGASGAITKTGTGKLILSGANTYNGPTTITNGTLLVNNVSGSGTGPGAVTVLTGATLGGGGDIAGIVTVNSGGTLSPGSSIGTLTLDVPPVLGGTNKMEIDRNGGSPLSDKLIISSGTLTYGGTLSIVNLGAALRSGDTFTLFNAASATYAGSFSSITPATPGAGLIWDTSGLNLNGTIKAVCNGTLAASAGPNTNICAGSSTIIGGSPTATGGSGAGYTYSWSPATGLNDATLANPTATPASTTMYTVTITDSVGCTAMSSVTVGVDVAPAITGQPANTTVCSGSSASFSVAASGSGLTYAWSKHSNGGWGSSWTIGASGGGTFLASSTGNDSGDSSCNSFNANGDINTSGGNSLGLYGGSGGESVSRDFPSALTSGQAFSIDMDNGNVDFGQQNGFALQTSGGTFLFSFYFLGGSTYKFYDTTEHDTGIAFTRTGLRIQLIMNSGSTYKLIVTPCGGTVAVFSGTFANAGNPGKLILFNNNGSGGGANDLFFNNIIAGGSVDNADNYSSGYVGQDKGDQPIVAGNGASSYTTPTLTTADSGAQYQVVASGCEGTTLSSLATVTVNPPATVNAGPDQTVCGDSPATTLAGSFGGAASSAHWSGGTGSFNPNTNTLNAVYTPSASEITAGSVTLTLTTDDPAGPCGPVSDTIFITFDKVTATNVTFVRNSGVSLKISKTNLVTHASDSDSETLSIAGVGTDGVNLLTTNGATLSMDADWIFYTNSVTPNVNDSFVYKVTDSRGCVAMATVFVQVAQNEIGQGTTVTVSNGVATVGFAGIPGRSYQVQRSTNLVDWVTLVTTNAPANGVFEWVDDFNDLGVPPADPPSSAYYRLRLP